MKTTLEAIRRMGLSTISVYVSTLQGEFDLATAWRSIEQLMDMSFAHVKRQATLELGKSGKTAAAVLRRAERDLGQIKGEVYRELQIQSHDLRAKIARRSALGRRDEHPTTEAPSTSFMRDTVLKDFAAHASKEACHCFDSHAYTAAAIMAGSAMETVLLDALLRHRAVDSNLPLDKSTLSDLIHLALKAGLVGQSTSQLTHWVRENRDLVHPGRVLRRRQTVEREEASMALSILNLICKELRCRSGVGT
jgi:hypothetical protein